MYIEIWERHGRNAAAAARSMGIAVSTFKDALNREKQDPVVVKVMEADGTRMVPKTLWKRGVDADGNKFTAQYTPDRDGVESLLDKLEGRFQNIPTAPSIIRPQDTREELRAFYPLFDVHLAMKWKDHGLQAAVDRLESGMAELIADTKPAASCLILNGGDFTHQNDGTNQTVKSKNPLDVDGGYEDTIDAAVTVTVHLIEMAMQRHDRVVYKALAGNHDPHTAHILYQALRQRYRDCDRVEIEGGNFYHYLHEWGVNFLGATHGDARPGDVKSLLMSFAARYCEAFGRTSNREVWTGHLHNWRVEEHPGMTHHRARAITPPDSHVRHNLYTSRSEIQSVIYHKELGRKGGAQVIFPDADWAE